MRSETNAADTRTVLFGTAVNGYNKKDVNNYIAFQDETLSERIRSFETKIHTLEHERDAACEVYVAQIASLKSELEACKTELGELREKAAASDECRILYENARTRLAAAETTVKPDSDEVIELRRKAALYDSLIQMPSDSVTGATATAENLIQSARREADTLRREAETELTVARESVRENAVAALKDIFGMIDTTADESIGEILKSIHEAEFGASQLSMDITKKNRDAASRVTYLRSVLEANIERRISEISIDGGDAPDVK